MGLDMIEEKNLNDIITYSLDYPKMVISEAKEWPVTNIEDFATGLYVGYIGGVFFDGFLKRNKRFLDSEEYSDFHGIISKRTTEIKLKIQAHLHKK
ncbi:MAG: hypothetical protein ACREA1_03800 [Nitrosotalea sp.]|uniref:Uncharacterized protein n=1 Tax=Nitrosotalea devaniterrae TaxID=1078905 RepID=A0A128A2I2_9ARCH|nr:conserved protein of unknown function [Candidatus Nitrosotalea devanaterra]